MGSELKLKQLQTLTRIMRIKRP